MQKDCSVSLLEIQIANDGHGGRLSPGEGIRRGQRFAASLQLTAPRFIYMTRISPTQGITQQLYPQVQALATAEHSPGTVRIPQEGEWLTLDHLDNEEKLCIVATASPLDAEGSPGRDSEPKSTGAGNREGEVLLIELPVER